MLTTDHLTAVVLGLSAALTGLAEAGQLAVTSVEPPAHALNAPTWSPITVHFDQAVDQGTVTSNNFWAFGKWSGTVSGSFSFANGNQAVTLHPDSPFSAGEMVTVYLSHDLAADGGESLRDAGYSFQYWTAARPAAIDFDLTDTMTTNRSGESSRPYGGIGSDMNGDGFLDITVVNEDTADLRVFLNMADGTGAYEPFMEPTFPVNNQASPSEPADFNRDGVVDICVANINTGTVSILLGSGDGSLGPQQEIAVGVQPRGVAVLDVDGDGDQDIANTNSGSGNYSILLNNGAGVFGGPTFHEGGGSSEWALASADMDDDGILDLVLGARGNQRILVHRGNGDGTLTQVSSTPSGGAVWMLVVGDVNGDGIEDVAGVNSSNNSGSILLGVGGGDLSDPQTYATDPFPLATDLGDLDGDGDLDWVTSSFGGDWRFYRNSGTGVFAFHEEFNAPDAASCTVLLDIDNDSDLDLALIDELADVVEIHRNSGTAGTGDVNNDGVVDVQDLTAVILSWGPCPAAGFCEGDTNGDGIVDVEDMVAVILNWS